MTIRLRAATSDDATAMGGFIVRAWRDAYRGQMPDDYLAGLDPVERGETWRSVLTDPASSGEVHLAIDRDRVVGLVAFGDPRDDDAGPQADVGELFAIYADADYWGRGVGPALHDLAVNGLAGRGKTEAVLWVLDGNARAIRFYEREGWKPDGAQRVDKIFGITVDEVRYRRPLD